MNLKGKVAIVTGAGGGIGFGIAEVLADHGAKLVLAQRHLEPVQRAAERLAPADVLPLAVDIRNPSLVAGMVEAAIRHFGQVNILVNNASITGMSAIAPVLSCKPEMVDDIVDINLKGTFYCSQYAARHMVERGDGGSIVHVSSVGAYAAQEFASVYCATKAAQAALAQSMALEFAPHKIRVNCVAPGDIDTETSATIVTDKEHAGASSQYVRATPLGFRGSPRDIGNAVAYLVSDEARFVTGTTLLVDGGFLSY
jgi:NAD(P)-dependent dehydrogenase (short-subunit alcohol dehydrogenase family)